MELTKPLQVEMVPFEKGKSVNPAGRPRGAKNKIPKNLVAQILQIAGDLDKQGKGLKHCVEKDPRWFFENFLKLMVPKNHLLKGAEPAAPVIIEVGWVRAGDKAGNL
jgi:hypothetical protein